VLTAYGRAYGVLSENSSELTPEQRAFLEQSVEGLAQDGRVIPIRLALFAEMVKGKPWTPASLGAVGGIYGVGMMFLEETFSAPTAPPEHRLHQKAAQAILKALLPRAGSDIMGQMRPEDELREAAGYAGRPREFDDVIAILDQELRLITPTDPEGPNPESTERPVPAGRYYQLTHDYLVPSIREWLTRKQRETRRGRAELRLAERAALWTAKPENRHLPSVLEWANIRLLTKKRDWTEGQRAMMKRAGRVHRLRGLGLAIAAATLAVVVIDVRHRIDEDKQITTADNLVERLLIADTSQVPGLIQGMARYRRWTDPALHRIVADPARDPRAKLHASLALLSVDPTQTAYVEKQLLDAAPKDLPVLLAALEPFRQHVAPKLWDVLASARPDDPRVLPVAGALASYDPESPRWADLGDKVAGALVTVNPIYLQDWLDDLRAVHARLNPHLARIFRNRTRSAAVQNQATNILADYAKDDPLLLADLLMDGDAEAFLRLFPVAAKLAETTSPHLQAELRKSSQSEDEQAKDALAERQARAAVALMRLGHADALWPLLKHSADPRLRSFLVNGLSTLGADPHAIVAALERLNSPVTRHAPPATQTMDAILFHPGTSQRRALILTLGTFKTNGLSSEDREPLIAKLLDLYEYHPDAGIHGAAEWVLRQWEQQPKLRQIDARLKGKDKGDRRWFVNKQGQTFVIVEGPLEFRMGSPPNEPERFTNESTHLGKIPYRFAIAAKEVTFEQGQPHPALALPETEIKRYGLTADHPIIAVSWFTAAAYCNWLSEQEGLPESEWCYRKNDQGNYAEGMRIKADALRLKGYRIPTEAEWEYASRAGALTSRYYGNSKSLLGHYARYLANSGDPSQPQACARTLPNDLGLFDTLGNAYEWCLDRYGTEPDHKEANLDAIIDTSPRLLRGGSFVNRPEYLRSASRSWTGPSYQTVSNGFRFAKAQN
jgi:formylglycine-generating enzyme required for sulfatase activity